MTGVRSYGSSLRMQNVFNPDALPDAEPRLKKFATKILRPLFTCVEVDCGTTIGRKVPIPEISIEGLISLETNSPYTDEDETELLSEGETFARTRDSVACLSAGGTCAYCGNGYLARVGSSDTMSVGEKYEMGTSPRSYQNYVAGKYAGSLLGFNTLNSDPLSAPEVKWGYLTSHVEMDRMCGLLRPFKVNRDELEYLYTIEDILERALAIIATYGVYANA